MRKIIILCTFFLSLFLCTACHKQVQVLSVTTEAIPVDSSADELQDLAYLEQLAPCKAAVEQEMNVELGYAPEDMWVAAPECPMLNWATDVLLAAAKQVYPGQVDVAIANMGGMRRSWSAGPITKGMVFELMPFDNQLVVLTLTGTDMIALCESFARYGAQGVAGMRVKIVDNQLADVRIGGKPVNPNATYTVATSDYLSGGADHMDALKNYSEMWKSDLLIRDIYLQAVTDQHLVGADVDGRMTVL